MECNQVYPHTMGQLVCHCCLIASLSKLVTVVVEWNRPGVYISVLVAETFLPVFMLYLFQGATSGLLLGKVVSCI